MVRTELLFAEFECFTVKWDGLLVSACLIESFALAVGLHQRVGLGMQGRGPEEQSYQ
jgi:hypothetical protein